MATLNPRIQTLLINKGYTSNAGGTGMLDLIEASPNAVRWLDQFATLRGTQDERMCGAATNTMKTIAVSAVFTRVGGRFGIKALKAGNDGVWEVAA